MGSSQSLPRNNDHEAPDLTSSQPSKRSPAQPVVNLPPEITAENSNLPPKLTKTRPGPATPSATFLPAAPSIPAVPILSPTSFSVLYPTLGFGAYSAGAGLFVGSFQGILRSNQPVLFSVATSVQWGVAGTTFHGVRSLVLQSLVLSSGVETSRTRFVADVLGSAAAGGIAGAVGGGKRTAGPAAVIFGVVGCGGHWIHEKVLESAERERKEGVVVEKMGWIEWATTRRWSPLRMLSDQEYKEILMGKLNKVEAEIALLEDDIKAIRKGNEKQKD